MGTEFTNLVAVEGESGEVITKSEWQVWDCIAKKWSNAATVVLRNTLIAANHPTPGERFCIGEIPDNSTNAKALDPFKPPGKDSQPYFLDLASGSRTHGRFTFALAPTIGKAYYGEDWKRIIYGSIMHTGCKKMVYRVVKFAIVDDADDPIYTTGDSHAKATAEFMSWLALPIKGDTDPDAVDSEVPVQFRCSEFKEWVGKGTVAYNPAMDGGTVDIAIPISSLKGKKPPLGIYEKKLLFGVVFEAEERRAKVGWMLIQWFSFETLEEDGIISRLEEKAQGLRDSYNNIVNLAEMLRISTEEAKQEIQENDTIQSEAEYENTMIRIIQADANGVLLLHPYVVRRVKERMRSLWLNLAKSAGMRFFSLMTQPDEYFKKYHVYRDGKIIGGKVFCAKDFPEGEYIVFCNPMRHWGDVQLWQNKHEGQYINASGVMASSTELFLSLGRDFDGDFVQLIRSSAYPAIAQAIREFSDTPNVDKLPKVALSGSLQEIAIRSMNDLTGVVASLLGRARAGNAENAVILIPPGGEDKVEREMRIIDFLSQQLQIAVDSIKSAYPNNVAGLDAVSKFLDEVEAEAPFIKGFKAAETYLDMPCAVDPDSQDTVSRVVRLVNSYFRAPDLKEDATPRTYEKVLFGDVAYAPEQLTYALKHRDEYRADFRKAIEWRNNNDNDSTLIREAAQKHKASKEKILNAQSVSGKTYSPESWVSAYWAAAHRAETGDAGMVFTIFADEIVEKLTGYEPQTANIVEVYGCQYNKWAAPQDTPWHGQQVITRVIMQEVSGKQRMAMEMKYPGAKWQTGWEVLGLIGEKNIPYLTIGQTRDMKIYTISFRNGVTSSVKLFDTSMTQEEIYNHLTNKD